MERSKVDVIVVLVTLVIVGARLWWLEYHSHPKKRKDNK